MKNKIIILILLGFVGFCPSLCSAGDPVAGKQKATPCIECHGNGGYSKTPMVPNLAGQLPQYIVRAIFEFKTGIRTNVNMTKKAELIVTEDLEDIAAYFAIQPVMKGKPTGSALSKEGEKLFLRERCTYCHNDDGRQYTPFVPVVPLIGGQRKDYLIKAITDIRDANRPADAYGLMREKILKMSDEQIEALAEYVSGL